MTVTLLVNDSFASHPKVAALTDHQALLLIGAALYWARWNVPFSPPILRHLRIDRRTTRRFTELGWLLPRDDGSFDLHTFGVLARPGEIPRVSRRKWTQEERDVVYERDGYRCVYCGEREREQLVLDHAVPLARGGGDSIENLVTACVACNSSKGAAELETWLARPEQTR